MEETVVTSHLEISQKATTLNETLHELRKAIDATIKWTAEVKSAHGSVIGREISLVYTKLQEAKMWTGKCLEVNGSELPKEFRDEAKV